MEITSSAFMQQTPTAPITNNASSKITSSVKDNKFLSELSQNKLTEMLKNYLKADASGNVNEEQLQFAIVDSMLTHKSSKLGDEFTKAFAIGSSQGLSVEDNVKQSLKSLTSSGSLTNDEASMLNGVSFDAAQLDTNLIALYDGKGGPNDPTIAVASLDQAITKANALIQSMRDGKADIKTRGLDVASNSKATNDVGSLSSAAAANSASASSHIGSGSGSFLWKPVSDSNGKLVVLLPSKLSGQVASAEIYSSLPPSDSNLIEKGKFSGNANGGRDHFRFSKTGASYPDGVYVVAKLRDGSYTSFQINETSSRTTK